MGNVKVKDIANIMNEIAPTDTAADFDNVGLLVGDHEAEVTGIALALDVDNDVIDFAANNGCNMIITHHPIIFSPLKAVLTDEPVGKMVYKLISLGIAVYAAHTNYDKASGGADDIFAEAVGMTNIQRADGGEFGRTGSLDGITAKELKARLSQKFGKHIITTADDAKIINTAFSCSGSGSGCIKQAIKHCPDIFIAGELTYHAALDAKRCGVDVMLVSHQYSEQCAVNILKDTLQNHLNGVKYNVRVILAPFIPFWK